MQVFLIECVFLSEVTLLIYQFNVPRNAALSISFEWRTSVFNSTSLHLQLPRNSYTNFSKAFIKHTHGFYLPVWLALSHFNCRLRHSAHEIPVWLIFRNIGSFPGNRRLPLRNVSRLRGSFIFEDGVQRSICSATLHERCISNRIWDIWLRSSSNTSGNTHIMQVLQMFVVCAIKFVADINNESATAGCSVSYLWMLMISLL